MRFIQLALVMCVSAAALAGEDFDRTMTAFTAMTLNQIKSLADLQKIDLGAANSKILKDELSKNAGPPFAPKNILQVDATTIKLEFADSSVTLGTKELSKNFIYVNGRKVKLDKNKTYYNYKAEIDEILKSKKNAFWSALVPEAYAEARDPSSYLSWGLVQIQRAMGGMNRVENLKDSAVFPSDLEKEIIEAYKYEMSGQKGQGGAITTKFECEGERVKSITMGIYKADGTLDSPFLGTMSEMLDGTWSFLNNLGGNGDAQTKATVDGIVIEKNKRTSRRIFSESPFYEFPLVAKRCCQKAGCYEKVKQSFARSLRTMESKSSSGAQ